MAGSASLCLTIVLNEPVVGAAGSFRIKENMFYAAFSASVQAGG